MGGRYNAQRADEILNDDELADLFQDMKRETQDKRTKEMELHKSTYGTSKLEEDERDEFEELGGDDDSEENEEEA